MWCNFKEDMVTFLLILGMGTKFGSRVSVGTKVKFNGGEGVRVENSTTTIIIYPTSLTKIP